MTEEGPDSPLLMDIYDRMDQLDPATFEKRAGELLFGLGFTHEMMAKKTKDLSGGWRMRVALAKALFIKPTLLLLGMCLFPPLSLCVWVVCVSVPYVCGVGCRGVCSVWSRIQA